MGNNREFILAIVLSILVLVGWQFFIGVPQLDKNKTQQPQTSQTTDAPKGSTAPPAPSTAPASTPAPTAGTPAPVVPGAVPAASTSREAALVAAPRIRIETPSLTGSINLVGARLDDLNLRKYNNTVDPDSGTIVLLSPAGGPNAYYAEYGWTAAPGAKLTLPGKDTRWKADRNAKLTPSTPVTLTYDNGAGLIFRRTLSVDEDYLFTVRQDVENTTSTPVHLYPYALVSRHGTPKIRSYYILHEGLLGVLGEEGLIEIDYSDIRDEKLQQNKSTGGWLGITDKYWAVVLVPDQKARITARFADNPAGGKDIYQTDYLVDAGITIPAGGKAGVDAKLFAGAKVVSVVDRYVADYGIKNFDLLIDWGWFYFLTKPLFQVLDLLYRMIGNFGVAILIVTVAIKALFFPLANKSYVSMSKMKKLQPEMTKLKERFPDDKARQQEAMMKMYKKEKVNPASGCLPILIQIPVFFSLYKVLFVTIEMRHAPFFGWIRDLAAPDPTTVFNLFGLLPFDVPAFLMIGVWPLLMGITMFLQMRLNPTPTDPVQAQIFTWMPIIFTFLLARFPAGLVIYWAWNNLLSITQQYVIMRRQGVKVEMWGNIKSTFAFLKKSKPGKT